LHQAPQLQGQLAAVLAQAFSIGPEQASLAVLRVEQSLGDKGKGRDAGAFLSSTERHVSGGSLFG
jgi:hypothetical protein